MRSLATAAQPLRRAYAYVRVSVDDDGGENASIAAQIAAIEAMAAKDGFELLHVFQEPDVSGRKLARKQFDRMIALASAEPRPVDAIIVYSLSRFARRLLTQVVSEHRLTQAGVELISVTEGSANDPTSKLMRSIVAIINEKYALDASLFTRRDRRGNALAGYWNGGPVPFGYRAVVASSDGRKERKKLAIHEEDAALVRLIHELALTGLDGQPMGTRAIAAHLNSLGLRIKGKPFRHSNVDGILTREHYQGHYFDRTCPEIDGKARAEHAILVPCPMIIEPGIAAAVRARRATAAPRVTAPRIVNSPVLLTGICYCGAAGCGAGLTIRSGKAGSYAYYTCTRRAEAAKNCSCKPIRKDELDKIVLDGLLERVLKPERLTELLAAVLDLSVAADEQRKQDLGRVQRARQEMETKLRRLLDVVAEGLMSLTDKVMAERLAEYKQSIASLSQTESNLKRALASTSKRITDETVKQFGLMLKQRLTENTAMRKAYVRLLIDRITVNDNEIVIEGSRAALEAAVSANGDLRTVVPSFDREWCRLQETSEARRCALCGPRAGGHPDHRSTPEPALSVRLVSVGHGRPRWFGSTAGHRRGDHPRECAGRLQESLRSVRASCPP